MFSCVTVARCVRRAFTFTILLLLILLKMKNTSFGSPALLQKPGNGPKPSKVYKLKIDGKMFDVQDRYVTGTDILVLTQKTPLSDYRVALQEQGHNMRPIGLDEVVDLEVPGVEKFVTYHTGHSDGEEGPQGPFLFELPMEDQDYANRLSGNLERVLDGGRRWVLLHNFSVPEGYNLDKVTAAVLLPVGYPQSAPDMVYFYPALSLTSGKRIHASEATEMICGKKYQRWSRHFLPQEPWRPGIDSLETYALMIHGWLEREVTR